MARSPSAQSYDSGDTTVTVIIGASICGVLVIGAIVYGLVKRFCCPKDLDDDQFPEISDEDRNLDLYKTKPQANMEPPSSVFNPYQQHVATDVSSTHSLNSSNINLDHTKADR